MGSIYTIPELQDILSPIFSRYGIRKAVLFGSFAKQQVTTDSDIDIFVDSGLRGLSFVGFMEEVRRAVGREIDLFDVSHIEEGSQIDYEIRNTGVMVYEK